MNYRQLSEDAATRATECSRRGDTEGDFYSRGARDAYALAATYPEQIREPRLSELVAVITMSNELWVSSQLGADRTAVTVLGSYPLQDAPRIRLSDVWTIVPITLTDDPQSETHFSSVADYARDRGLTIGRSVPA